METTIYIEMMIILHILTLLSVYRVVKRNYQVEKIVNLGHPNDFMTQKSSLIFVKTIFGWDQVKEILPSLKVASIEAKIQLLKNLYI